MSLAALFVALWLLTLLASEHLLANRGIVLGQGLPQGAAWLLRLAYMGGTGGLAFVFLLVATDVMTAS
ncbi:MAG: hypothetical protein U1F45_02460 [Burkholderiales bacterium]